MPAPANLVYFPDNRPGISRRRRGKGWSYIAPDGTSIDDQTERQRINALAVPPAYSSVWISPRPNGHLQATGYDARERKQYRYHVDWRSWREATKFDSLADFGEALPAIRRRITRDLSGEAGERDYALAAVLALIDRLSLRVGNADYARENRSYGATTLTARHYKLSENGINLSFRAKGGLRVRRSIHDRTLSKALGALHDLPGKTLISWVDDDGQSHAVSSDQVNDRLSEIAGCPGVTAKTFRTWTGSVAALEAALSTDSVSIKAMSTAASERLHNTPTVARNSYIHPRVIALTEEDAEARAALIQDLPPRAGLRVSERALLKLLT